VTGFVNQTGAITAAAATSAALTVSGAAQSAIKLAAVKAETVTITADKNVVLNAASDLSAAKVVTIDTSGAFRDSSTNGLDAVSSMTLSGAGTKAAATFDTLVGATNLSYSQTVNASGLKAGLTFTGGINAGSGNLAVDVSGVTGAVNTGAMSASATAGSLNVTASNTAANTFGLMTAKNVTVNAADALGGVSYTSGNDITASSVTITGPTITATDVDITGSGTSLTVDVSGGLAVDTVDATTAATVLSTTVKGDLGVGTDVVNVVLADYTTDTTSTVTVDLAGLTADTTTQNNVAVDITLEQSNAVSVTGSAGTDDQVTITGARTEFGTNGLTLSGIEKLGISDNITLKAATLTGQTIEITGASTDVVTLSGTAGADTFTSANLTSGGHSVLTIDMGAAADTVTVAAMTETIALDDEDSGTFASTTETSVSTATYDVITGLSTSDKIFLSAYTAASNDTGADGKFDSNLDLAGNDLTVTVGANGLNAIRGDYNATAQTFTESATGADKLLAYDADDLIAVTDIDAVVLVGLGANTIGCANADAAGILAIA